MATKSKSALPRPNRTAAILFVLAAVIAVTGVALYSWRAAVIAAAVAMLLAAVANLDVPERK